MKVEEMRTYKIKPTVAAPQATGKVAGTAWENANVLNIDKFPWYKRGVKQGTAVRVLYDPKNIYVQFRCTDRHIYSRTTELNGPVYQDSCVEMFISPDPSHTPAYFNLEMNCCGVFHVGFGEGRDNRRLITADVASGIKIASSESGVTRDESPDDRRWWITATVPFETISKFTGMKIRPIKGDKWRANFYRCGGKIDDQYACWNRINWPGPNFHLPEFFGEITFA